MAELKTKISANADPFKKEMGKVFAEIDKLKSVADGGRGGLMSMLDVGKAAGPIGMAAAAVVGLGAACVTAGIALKGMIDRSAEYVDTLGAMASKINVSWQEIQQLEVISKVCNVELASFTTSFKKLSEAIIAASAGDKAAIATFDTLGISLEAIKDKTPTEQLKMTLSAIADLSNENVRAAVCTDLFGKSGLELGDAMAGGSVGVNKLFESSKQLVKMGDSTLDSLGKVADEYDKLGINGKRSMSEIVAITSDQLLPILEKMNVVLEQMDKDGSLQSIAVALSTAVGTIANAITTLVNALASAGAILDKIPGAKRLLAAVPGGGVVTTAINAGQGLKNINDTANAEIQNRKVDAALNEFFNAKTNNTGIDDYNAKLAAAKALEEETKKSKKELEDIDKAIADNHKASVEMAYDYDQLVDKLDYDRNQKALERNKKLNDERIKLLGEVADKEKQIAQKQIQIADIKTSAQIKNYEQDHKMNALSKIGLTATDNIAAIIAGKTYNKNFKLDQKIAEKFAKAEEGTSTNTNHKIRFSSREKKEIKRLENKDKNDLIGQAKLMGFDLDKKMPLNKMMQDFNTKKAEKDAAPIVKEIKELQKEVKELTKKIPGKAK